MILNNTEIGVDKVNFLHLPIGQNREKNNETQN